MEWTLVDGSKDHHRVWLWRLKPGNVRRTRILVGEVRRYRLEGRLTRWWRTFPEGVLEYPEVFENHFLAMDYLKNRWETRSALPEIVRPVPRSADDDAGWDAFFGMIDSRKALH
jgi:hypothetical protein